MQWVAVIQRGDGVKVAVPSRDAGNQEMLQDSENDFTVMGRGVISFSY